MLLNNALKPSCKNQKLKKQIKMRAGLGKEL